MSSTEIENLISILTTYREEWMYRDTYFAKTFWKFSYLSLIIGFFPSLLEKFKFKEAPILSLPSWVFSIAGIVIALFGLFISLNELKRIEKLDKIYYDLIEKLPGKYRIERIIQERATIPRKTSKIFSIRTNHLFCGVYIVIVALIGFNGIILAFI